MNELLEMPAVSENHGSAVLAVVMLVLMALFLVFTGGILAGACFRLALYGWNVFA